MTNTIYDDVTATIIAQLEAGVMPWARPWTSSASDGLPANATTRRNYSGINVLILWGTALKAGYSSQLWLTYKQAQALGGNVRKGEKGTTVCYADRFVTERERERSESTGDDPRSIAFLKRFSVFNVAQCDGLPEFEAGAPMPLIERHEAAQALIDNSGAVVRLGGNRAFYDIGGDYVQLPPQPAFADQLDYFRVALHELTHWTGAKRRLNRDQSGQFGSALYAKEELVAEIGAAFVCASLGIETVTRHADYVANWLAVLKADNRAIFKAASAAAKAADYLRSASAELVVAA